MASSAAGAVSSGAEGPTTWGASASALTTPARARSVALLSSASTAYIECPPGKTPRLHPAQRPHGPHARSNSLLARLTAGADSTARRCRSAPVTGWVPPFAPGSAVSPPSRDPLHTQRNSARLGPASGPPLVRTALHAAARPAKPNQLELAVVLTPAGPSPPVSPKIRRFAASICRHRAPRRLPAGGRLGNTGAGGPPSGGPGRFSLGLGRPRPFLLSQ